MKLVIKCCSIVCLVFILLGLASPLPHTIGGAYMIEYFISESRKFSENASKLQYAIDHMDGTDRVSTLQARQALVQCRYSYKRIEFLLEYFFKSSSLVFNAPAKYEIEEPEMAYVEPIGLQVIESLLFEQNVAINLSELKRQSDAVNSSAADLHSLVYNFQPTDQEILESLQLETIRVITLGVAGFDSPLLKSGIQESYESLKSIHQILQPYLTEKNQYSDSVTYYLAGSLSYLSINKDFDSFDRLTFMTKYALPLRYHLNCLIKSKNLQLNTNNVLNYDAPNIFSRNALNMSAFSNGESQANKPLIELGRRLFLETSLSGNNLRSCATCHQPDKYFTDALPKSMAFDNHTPVKRNTPTLLYAGFQYAQFWDGRAKTLDEQVKIVIESPDEMNGDYKTLLKSLTQNEMYVAAFSKAFPSAGDNLITIDNIATALSAFVRTLNPLNSAFDHYIQGEESALNARQKNGFNLFMGKAQCGTCHFAPLFNGLTPPLYTLTELEVIGTTKSDNLDKPENDTDAGRYAIFPIEFNKGAFKTPTVRNAAVTSPYMHNGSFHSLEKVITFYDKGGGKGLGLPVSTQTLSSQPLLLTKTDVSDLISFLEALTDKLPAIK